MKQREQNLRWKAGIGVSRSLRPFFFYRGGKKRKKGGRKKEGGGGEKGKAR